MDAFLAVTSKRDERRYSDQPIPEEAVTRILEAGRVAGSAQNRQPWTFLVLGDRGLLEQVSGTVFEPSNLLGCQLAIAVVVGGKGPVAFDSARASQNMMLAAWNDGIGSSPNGIADHDRMAELLGIDPEEERVQIVLSFGYPERPRDPEARPPEEWLRRADRRPLEEITRYL